MSIVKHRISVLDPQAGTDFYDKTILGQKIGVVTAAGGGAGATVSTAITFAEGLPANYQVIASFNLAAAIWITAKTSTGFTVNVAPLLAATTLGAGALDVLVLAA